MLLLVFLFFPPKGKIVQIYFCVCDIFCLNIIPAVALVELHSNSWTLNLELTPLFSDNSLHLSWKVFFQVLRWVFYFLFFGAHSFRRLGSDVGWKGSTCSLWTLRVLVGVRVRVPVQVFALNASTHALMDLKAGHSYGIIPKKDLFQAISTNPEMLFLKLSLCQNIGVNLSW